MWKKSESTLPADLQAAIIRVQQERGTFVVPLDDEAGLLFLETVAAEKGMPIQALAVQIFSLGLGTFMSSAMIANRPPPPPATTETPKGEVH